MVPIGQAQFQMSTLVCTGAIGTRTVHIRAPVARAPWSSGCPFRKSYPDVFVMQSAKDWDGSNVADPLNNALQGCVLLQRQMRARTVVISRIGQQDAAQMTLTTD